MRADAFFAQKYGSRTRAKDVLKRGEILRGGRALSPSDEVHEGDSFVFLSGQTERVSRGGFKLERGLDAFSVSVAGGVYADLGASTGGFTEVLLERGARRVYAVDVGKAQLAPVLAADERVVVMDETNARYLTRDHFPEPLDGVVSDLSFISLTLVLPAVAGLLDEGKYAFVLFKPQFECGGEGLGKSGILPVSRHRPLLIQFYTFCVGIGLMPRGIVNAPIHPRKNIEYIVCLCRGGTPIDLNTFLRQAENLQEIGENC